MTSEAREIVEYLREGAAPALVGSYDTYQEGVQAMEDHYEASHSAGDEIKPLAELPHTFGKTDGVYYSAGLKGEYRIVSRQVKS